MNEDSSEYGPEAAQLRFLRRLVQTLTIVMIFGVLAIVTLLVIRLLGDNPVPLPDIVTLPDGAVATAFTRGPDWYAVVTEDNLVLFFDAASGEIFRTITVRP